MAYYPYSAVNGVYKEKENWTKANQAGDINAQNIAAENANKYYEELIKNGYKDVADQLKASNYEQAKAINDEWAKKGKTSTRDRYYSLGQSQGLSKEYIDNLIGWDDVNKQVTFDGKAVGKPDVNIDGVTYWGDTSAIDKSFNDYLKKGKTSTRDHFYSLGQSQGLSKEDMDKLIGWDDATKQVTFNGQAIGKPDVIVDGVSYWSDTSGLNKVFDDYMAKGKTGKTATRDYFYSLGQARGMSKEEIDNLIGWDAQTGEVTFGGKKIGKPDWVVDGVSYWSDTSVLDNAFNDYIKRTGNTIDDTTLQGQYNNDIQRKIDQRYDVILGDRDKYTSEYDKVMGYANQDITQTDEYKSIYDNMMKMYSLDAMQGRGNEMANGAASNGGNIDSFAAANALRQQMAITAKGQVAANQAGLDAYNARVNNITNILDGLGIYQKDSWNALGDVIDQESKESQRLFDNQEAHESRLFKQGEESKKNEMDIQEKLSSITGKVSDTLTKMLNSDIWDENGKIINSDDNFRGQIAVLRQLYNLTTDEGQRASLWERMRILEKAQNQKIDEGKLNEEKTYEFQGALPQTEEGRQFDKSDATVLKTLDTEKDINDANIASKEKIEADANASAEKIASDEIAAEERMNTADNASAEKIATTQQTSTTKQTSTATEKNINKNEIDATVSHWLYSPWADFDESVEWKTGYSDGTHRMQYIAAEKMADADIRSFVKAALVAGGYTESEATKKLKEYEQNIAVEIAQIEHKDYQDADVIKSIKKRYGWS